MWHGVASTPNVSHGHVSSQMLHRTLLRVRYGETDQMGVVYHPNYLVWCELGRTELIRELGAPYAQLERAGVALAVVEAQLRYMAPARYDELVEVATAVADVRSRVVRFTYELRRGEVLLATAATTLVGMTREGRSTVIPDALREALDRFRDA